MSPDNQTPVTDAVSRWQWLCQMLILHCVVEGRRFSKGLARGEAALTAALLTADMGLWDWKVGSPRIYFSASYYQMLGYSAFQKPETATAIIDWALASEAARIRQHFASVQGSGQEALSFEYQALMASGDPCWLLCRGRVVDRGADGRPTRMVGTVSQIAEKKSWEAALKESERRLATLLDSLPGMAYRCVKRKEWLMEVVSEGCVQLTGYSPAQLTGNRQIYHDLIHPEDRHEVWARVERAVASNKPFEMVYRIRTAKGEDRWVWEKGRGVGEAGEQAAAIEGFTADVSAYKKIERDLEIENARLKSALQRGHKFGKIIGKSRAMRKVYDRIHQAAGSDAGVIIYGESGTGKELVAEAVHEMSARASGPFVSVNCGAIPESLMEREFFGHRKGAFTGAMKDAPGYLDRAAGGTLFLDEIGELPLGMQVKLLRAIEGGGYTAVGGQSQRKPDVRIIAATHRDLNRQVREGRMRADFFYRIHVVPVELPPLRERRSDIPLLVYHFLQRYSSEEQIATIPESHLHRMQAYAWPGNVRELQNMVQRYLTMKSIDFAAPDRPTCELGVPEQANGAASPYPTPLKAAVQAFEKGHIRRILAAHQGNRTRTARELGVDLRTLQRKIRTHGLS